MRKESGVFV